MSVAKLGLVLVVVFCLSQGTRSAQTKRIGQVLDNLIKKLEKVRSGANWWNNKDGGRRNKLALEASTNNLNEAKEIKMKPNLEVPNRLRNRYAHTKYWEKQFNKVWGGYDNTYAGWCHGQAKKAYYAAILECKDLGATITNTNTNMVAIFQNLNPRPGKSHYKLDITTKSGYSRGEKVESELHTRIAASVRASMNQFVAKVSASLETEVKSSLKSSVAIQNTSERTEKQSIYLDLTRPVYVYQVQYSSVMADGSTLDCWGTGWILSSNPIG